MSVAYRFRDVYDHLVRIADEAMVFSDRITALLDAHLSVDLEPPERGREGPHDHHHRLRAAHRDDAGCSG